MDAEQFPFGLLIMMKIKLTT